MQKPGAEDGEMMQFNTRIKKFDISTPKMLAHASDVLLKLKSALQMNLILSINSNYWNQLVDLIGFPLHYSGDYGLERLRKNVLKRVDQAKMRRMNMAQVLRDKTNEHHGVEYSL